MPNPENCVEFFMCRPGRAIQFSCPEHTRFNVAIQACDPATTVLCRPGKLPLDTEYTPIKAAPSTIQHTNTACIGQLGSVLLPHATSCSMFYQCSPNGVIAFECPAGTLFDANRRYCERSDMVSCQSSPIAPPTFPEIPMLPQVPILPPTIPEVPVMPQIPALPPVDMDEYILSLCNGKPQGYKVRNPFNCRQYVHCNSMDRSRIFTCAAGTAFDEARATCDWERNVQC